MTGLTEDHKQLWTDASSLDFLSAQYPWFLETYNGYRYDIQRADAVRYFALHHYGGVYLDLDIHPLRDLTPLLHYPFFACRTSPTGISNDVLGSIPRHPFLNLVIHSLQDYDMSLGLPYLTVMASTGPLFLSTCWVRYLGCWFWRNGEGKGDRGRVWVLVGADERPARLWRHIRGRSWHSWDARFIIWVWKHWLFIVCLGVVLGGAVWMLCRRRRRAWRRKEGGRLRKWELEFLD